MDDVTWAGLAATLTLLGAAYTFWAFRHRGAAAGTRGLAITLLPGAAWLTGTLRMFTRIAEAVADWATRLVFSPSVWVGTAMAGLAVVLWTVGGYLHGRNAQHGTAPGTGPGAVTGTTAKPLPPTRTATAPDDDLADIEAILRKRGIS